MTASNAVWRKASRSGGNNACVELRHTLDAVRDSKRPDGAVLTVDVHRFIAAVKAGQFEHKYLR